MANQPKSPTDNDTLRQPVNEGAWLANDSARYISRPPRPLSPIEAERQRNNPKAYANSVMHKFNARWQGHRASQLAARRASQGTPTSLPAGSGSRSTSMHMLTSSSNPPTASTLRREDASVGQGGSRKLKLKRKGEDKKVLVKLFKNAQP